MKMMQVFDVQNCSNFALRDWMIKYILKTESYSHGNDSYIEIYVSNDPQDESCFFHPDSFYDNSPEDEVNLLKMRDWMESDGLVYQDYPNDKVLIEVWW